jgi:hypothetical protein
MTPDACQLLIKVKPCMNMEARSSSNNNNKKSSKKHVTIPNIIKYQHQINSNSGLQSEQHESSQQFRYHTSAALI